MANRKEEEFVRLNAANTELMKSAREVYADDFDYAKHGEEKCKELRERVYDLGKSEFDSEFRKLTKRLPKNCTIRTKTDIYVWAANKICTKASKYKWKNFGGAGSELELQAGLFMKVGGKFYYGSTELKRLNRNPNSISYLILGRFMDSPGLFLSDKSLSEEMGEKKGSAKHRICELRKALRHDLGNVEVIVKTRNYIGYAEMSGYTLTIT